jgi:hypothetical protein
MMYGKYGAAINMWHSNVDMNDMITSRNEAKNVRTSYHESILFIYLERK